MLSISTQTEMTMSSREIAVFVGTTHDSVLKTCRELIHRGVVFGAETQYQHEQNKQWYPEFHFNYRNTMVLVSGYSVEIRAKIIDRWQELEKQTQLQVPQSFAEALQLAANQAKELEEKNQALAIAAPKAEFADAIAGAGKGVKLGQFAKTMGLGPVTIFRVLRELKIFMSRGDSYNLPYQEYVERGYFTVKQGTYETNSQTRISHTALITGKGEIWLRRKLLETGHLKAAAA